MFGFTRKRRERESVIEALLYIGDELHRIGQAYGSSRTPTPTGGGETAKNGEKTPTAADIMDEWLNGPKEDRDE